MEEELRLAREEEKNLAAAKQQTSLIQFAPT